MEIWRKLRHFSSLAGEEKASSFGTLEYFQGLNGLLDLQVCSILPASQCDEKYKLFSGLGNGLCVVMGECSQIASCFQS